MNCRRNQEKEEHSGLLLKHRLKFQYLGSTGKKAKNNFGKKLKARSLEVAPISAGHALFLDLYENGSMDKWIMDGWMDGKVTEQDIFEGLKNLSGSAKLVEEVRELWNNLLYKCMA